MAAAKRQVFGKVGIDMIAGPSEILVIADKTSRPDWIALDLLSQAEHDENAQSILITDSDDVINAVTEKIEINLQNLSRNEIAGKVGRIMARLSKSLILRWRQSFQIELPRNIWNSVFLTQKI